MADGRSSKVSKPDRKRSRSPADTDTSPKRVKVEKTEEEEKKFENNPYLSHWNDNSNNGIDGKLPAGSALRYFKRRETTAKQAFKAEDGDNNPFTGEPHSEQYFSILKTRRNLPVYKQRWAPTLLLTLTMTIY
jgi:pre-mRNA-splicing factor ATP-dependent RNA helicase DHX15/PRP43